MCRLWRGLEALPGLVAVPASWRTLLRADFDAFRAAFLRTRPGRAKSFPCPRECGCAHEVVDHGNGRLVGVCRCESWNCDDIPLKPEDVALLELNRPKLARSLASGFGLRAKTGDFGLPATMHVGAYAGAAVPVILTIQYDPDDFRRVVAELCARLRDPFILFAPTNRFVDGRCKELLASARSGFFDLESHVSLTAQGNLQPRQTAAELFSRFVPDTKEVVPDDVARRAFHLIEQLDSERVIKPPSVLAVFRLYCVKEMTADRVAKKCGCSKGTVINRLKLIREKTGMDPDQLRRFSTQFDKIEQDARDARAEHIHRKRLIDDSPSDEP